MSASHEVLIGRTLANRYRLEHHLGRGAMGDVYRARHAKVPRMFAVKVLLPDLIRDPKVVARFEREAELAGRLRHRNVTSVIDVGETDGTRYLVMDFAEGTDLGTLMGDTCLEPARAVALFRQIVEGLEHAHAHDVVHRDLKPENVIVEQSGNEEIARIVDFGVAILRDGAASKEDRLTTGGLVIGTPHYMAPELATGKPFDHRIDLFALGVMLYEMLTGVMPFDGTGVDVALKNLKVQTPPMSLRAPGVMVDPLLEALTHKLMAKKADDRPASAKDVRVLLDLIASDREAAALVLGVALPEAPRLAQASVPPPVAAEDVPTTDEMIAVSRPRWTLRIAAAALLIAITVGGFALIGRQEASAAVDLDIAAETPAPAIDTRAVVTEVAPPVSEEITAVPVGPAIPIATPMPGREVTPPKPAPAIATTGDVRGVIELYQTVARQLKAISDRRDMAADDLWQRYRLIRIQDAITSTDRRAEVQTELLKIQRAIDDRFAAP